MASGVASTSRWGRQAHATEVAPTPRQASRQGGITTGHTISVPPGSPQHLPDVSPGCAPAGHSSLGYQPARPPTPSTRISDGAVDPVGQRGTPYPPARARLSPAASAGLAPPRGKLGVPGDDDVRGKGQSTCPCWTFFHAGCGPGLAVVDVITSASLDGLGETTDGNRWPGRPAFGVYPWALVQRNARR